MAGTYPMDSQAFSKLMEPVTARLDALENRLEHIERVLSRLTPPFANLGPHTVDQRNSPYSNVSPFITPQKRSLDQNIAEAQPSTQFPCYQYRPLDASNNEIRLLSLDPSPNTTDPITGTILHINLEDATGPNTGFSFSGKSPGSSFNFAGPTRATHSYNALSYAWGNHSELSGTSILVAGTALPVKANLAAALRQLRGSKATALRSFWWIDALCINQADVRERNAQVALMRRIYGSAAHVWVWLGGAADRSGAAMALVRKLGRPPKRGPAHPEVEYPYIPDDVRRSNLACVAALFEREWWDRVWVRQEVALGNRVSFLCGGEDCTLEELTTAEGLLEDSLLLLRLDSKRRDMAPVLRLAQAQQARRAAGFQKLRDESNVGDRYIDLYPLLLHSRGCKASDAHDKVFGLLGLADPSFYELAVDYRLPVEDVYRMAATAIITKTGNLNILSAAQNVGRVNSLPSWAPNLIDPWKAQPFPTSTSSASTALPRQKPERCRFNASGKVLTVTGQVYGRIARLSAQAAQSTHSNQELARVLAAWTDFARSILTAKQEPSGSQFGSFSMPIFGSNLGDFATPEEGCMARLLLIQPKWMFTFGTIQSKVDVDVAYARSMLAPEAWIESRAADPGFQEGMRRYGVGRRVGQCRGRDVGLFPEDAREGDVVVCLYGADNPYVLRKLTDGYLLVGDASEFSPFF